jgi:putative ABC transport system substrate-binding protein
MTISIARRKFIAALGSAAFAWPIAARAAGGHPRIGVLDINSAEYDAHNLAAFRDGLQHLGYVEGRTVDVDYRYANGDTDRLAALALLVPSAPVAALAGPYNTKP